MRRRANHVNTVDRAASIARAIPSVGPSLRRGRPGAPRNRVSSAPESDANEWATMYLTTEVGSV
jgi:hypothetical protein